MKKVSILLALATMAFSSCLKQETLIQKPSEGKGYYITMSASTEPETPSKEDSSNSANTKLSVGYKKSDENGNLYYPLYWSAGDAVSIFNQNGQGVSANVTDADGTSGQAVFASTGTLSLSSTPHRITIAHPSLKRNDESLLSFTNGATNEEDALEFIIPRTQIQSGNNNSSHLKYYYFAYGTANVTQLPANQNLTIENDVLLQKKLAVVKVNLSTTQYQDYNLKGVKLYTYNRNLSGRMTCNITTGATTLVHGDTEYDDATTDPTLSTSVGADFETPELFNVPKTLYFVSNPRLEADVVDRDIILVIYLEKDGETVTIPKNLGRGTVYLNAGSLTELTVSNLTENDNSYEWFEPVEPRDLLDNYAYGPQNTYIVDWYPDGGTSTPATDKTYSMSVKARGDFTMLRMGEPTHYAIYSHSNHPDDASKHFVYINSPSETYTRTLSQANPYQYSVADDYTVSYKVNTRRLSTTATTKGSMGCWGQIAVYNESTRLDGTKSYTLLWTYMIWGRRTDAARVGDIKMDINGTEYVIMDRALGAPYPNELATRHNYGFDQDNIALFQWGRKDPFAIKEVLNGTSSLWQYSHMSVNNNYIMIVRHPHTMLVQNHSSTDGDWTYVHNNELWGAQTSGENATGGHKTIYDPCPAGYRVCDAAVVNYLTTYDSANKFTSANVKIQEPDLSALNYTAQNSNWIKKNWNSASDYSDMDAVLYTPCVSYTINNRTINYEIWPYHGVIWGSYVSTDYHTGWTANRSNNQYDGAYYWSNGYSSDHRGIMAQFAYSSGGAYASHGVNNNSIKANAMAVRCQKE